MVEVDLTMAESVAAAVGSCAQVLAAVEDEI